MLSIYFNKLQDGVLKFGMKRLLVLDVITLTIDEIQTISKTLDKLCIASMNSFYVNQINARFNRNDKVEAFLSTNIKSYEYDALFCYEVNLTAVNVVNTLHSIVYLMSERAFTGDPSAINSFSKITPNMFKRKSDRIEDVEVSVSKADSSLAASIAKPRRKCSFAVVNYNTSKLINILIKSIRKFVKSFDYDVWVFDNSDKETLTIEDTGVDVHVIDNTKGQVVDYSDAVKRYCNFTSKAMIETFAGFISMKHCMALQALIDDSRLQDDILICDSDIIVERDIDFIDSSFAAIGKTETKKEIYARPRILPFLCYINRRELAANGIKYFDSSRCHGCIYKRPVVHLIRHWR